MIRKWLFFPLKALFYKTGIKSKEIRNITGCENENMCAVLLCPFFHYCHLLNVCDSNNSEFGLSFATESAVLGTLHSLVASLASLLSMVMFSVTSPALTFRQMKEKNSYDWKPITQFWSLHIDFQSMAYGTRHNYGAPKSFLFCQSSTERLGPHSPDLGTLLRFWWDTQLPVVDQQHGMTVPKGPSGPCSVQVNQGEGPPSY